MTAPLKWRSQLCPCGYCPDGTRIFWRHNAFDLLAMMDLHFKPGPARTRATTTTLKHTGGPEAGK